MALAELIARHHDAFTPLFDPVLTAANTIPMDLSGAVPGGESNAGDAAIFARIEAAGALAGVGGYLERRSVYRETALFQGDAERCIHIGVDVFLRSGTPVYAPLDGRVHSYANRQVHGDYGPVIILRHRLDGAVFHSLYGHLALESLDGLARGRDIAAGTRLGWIGERAVNGNWPPHLHFQLIDDMQGLVGDYPGVVRPDELDFYRRNCPDPNPLLVR